MSYSKNKNQDLGKSPFDMKQDKMNPILAIVVMDEGPSEMKLALFEIILTHWTHISSVEVNFSCTFGLSASGGGGGAGF